MHAYMRNGPLRSGTGLHGHDRTGPGAAVGQAGAKHDHTMMHHARSCTSMPTIKQLALPCKQQGTVTTVGTGVTGPPAAYRVGHVRYTRAHAMHGQGLGGPAHMCMGACRGL